MDSNPNAQFILDIGQTLIKEVTIREHKLSTELGQSPSEIIFKYSWAPPPPNNIVKKFPLMNVEHFWGGGQGLPPEFVKSCAHFWRGGGQGSGALTRTEHPIIKTWLKVKPLENLHASLTKLTRKTKQKSSLWRFTFSKWRFWSC